LDQLATQVAATSATPDGAVTLAGARWAAQLGSLHVPEQAKVKATRPDAAPVPKEALPFGLLLNKSLTTMLADQPDLFAGAKKAGLGSAALSNAWSASMTKAFAASSTDFSRVLPDACSGGMLAVMASGNAADAGRVGGANCSPGCLTGGMYLHNQAKSLFDPQRASVVANPTTQVWNDTTYQRFAGWAKGLAVSQNPTLGSTLASQLGGHEVSTTCTAAASAAKSSLSTTLPGVFASLR
jgi:hypothetical protein